MAISPRELIEKQAYTQDYWGAYGNLKAWIDSELREKFDPEKTGEVIFDITEKALNRIDKRLPYFIPAEGDEHSKFNQMGKKGSFLARIKEEYENAGWNVDFVSDKRYSEAALGFTPNTYELNRKNLK